MTDPSGSMTFGYDIRGRLVNKTGIVNGQTYTLARTYTDSGRVSSITYPTGRTVDYDRASCACKVDGIYTTYNSTTKTPMENLSYRPFGIANGMDTGAGGSVDNVYDESGRLTIANPGAAMERTYTYDATGNLTSVNAPNTPWYNRSFAYDALNRLNHAEGPYGTIDYTYDDVGNRLTKVVSGVTDTYAYVTDTNILDTVTGTDTINYTHDANGNITGIGDKILIYNQNNRLIMFEEDGVTLCEYTYNGLGQRVIKEVDGVTTVFHYDFNGNIIAESDLSGNFTTEYLYKGKGRLAMVDVASGEIFYCLNDRLGTPQIMTDATNTVIWEAVYKPFGEAEVNPNSSVLNSFRLPGQYYDAETGLHYNYHRYYDPTIGRYLGADPIGLVGGINPYVYCLNDPVNFIDPYGLICWRTVGKGTVKVVFGVVGVVGGAFAASTPTGIGQVIGVTGVLAGSSSIGFGVSQIITGFADNEIAFAGVKEAVIQGTTSGLTQKNLLAANELLDMIPDVVSGRLKVDPSKLEEVLNLIEYGLSMGKSVDQIQKELAETGVLKSDDCE